MNKLTFVLLIATSVFFSNYSSAQTVDEIINKHISAIGGADKLNALKSVKMTGSVEVMPNVKAPMIILTKDKQAMRLDLTFQGMTMVQAFNGDDGWLINPFMGKKDPEKMNEDQIKESKDQVDLSGKLFNYKEKGHTVELIGKEDMEGTPVFKIKVIKKNANIETVFLDAETYLILKETTKTISKDLAETEHEMLYSDYRNIDGIMFPFAMEDRAMGAASGQVITVEKIEVNPPIDDAVFKMPGM